jgi:hypothetical protein
MGADSQPSTDAPSSAESKLGGGSGERGLREQASDR